MKIEMYRQMYLTETYQWYYQGKYNIVMSLLEKLGIAEENGKLTGDFGCGCGLTLQLLSKYGKVEGIDFSEEALEYCRQDFQGTLIHADLKNFTQQKKYDYAIALDVIEHIDDDITAINNIKMSLKDNGICIFTVPAFNHLWSQHDVNCMHKRRYSKHDLESKLLSQGLKVQFCTYYNFWLYFPTLMIRKAENFFRIDNANSRIENSFHKGLLNNILYKIFSSEKKFILNEKGFPFGVSIICVAKR